MCSNSTCFLGVVCYCLCMTQQLEKYIEFIALKFSLGLLPTQSGKHVINDFIFLISEDDPCSPNPCLNEGLCREIDSEWVCECVNGFRGTSCEASAGN